MHLPSILARSRFNTLSKKASAQIGLADDELSQEELAEAAKVHSAYVGMVEWSQRNITVLRLSQIAKALGVTASSLLAEAERSRR